MNSRPASGYVLHSVAATSQHHQRHVIPETRRYDKQKSRQNVQTHQKGAKRKSERNNSKNKTKKTKRTQKYAKHTTLLTPA
jgi:hypothetical protein